LDDFPESPPPGLVTIPNLPEVPRSHYTLAGYHPAGARAIRIDMLERLADLLRAKDSRVGFEATPEMLSITGMTLEQFVGLMAGLGYKGEKGERVKVKTVIAPKVELPTEPVSLNPVPEEVSLIVPEPLVEPEAEAAPEMEAFYTFTWAPKPRERPARPERAPRPEGTPRPPRTDRSPRPDRAPPVEGAPAVEGEAVVADAPRPPRQDRRKDGDGRRDGGKPREGGRPYEGSKPREERKPYEGKNDRGPRKDDSKPKYEARPPRVEKPIDPDNPFAALLALKAKL